jgi:sugar lactone lactonase YvrE
MNITNDHGLSELIRSDSEERLCTGFGFTEGPIWIANDNCLLFSDIPGSRTHRWRPETDTAEVYREPNGNSNGMTLDSSGALIVCEHSGRRISRGIYDASMESVVERYDGSLFNSPNDVVVHSSGAIYFTDPTYGLLPARLGREPFGVPGAVQELAFQGVYRVAPGGDTAELLNDEFTQPNGLAFTRDESVLYVGDSQDKIIRQFKVAPDGTLSGGDLFVDMRDDDRTGVPDGMKIDEDGRLWTTGAGGVWVIEANGTVLGQFETAEHAANLTFGGADFSSLFLTAQTSVYRVETAVRGVVPGSR